MINPRDHLYRITTHFRWAMAVLGLFIASFLIYLWTENQVDLAHESRLQSFKLAQELRQSSDDLTRMVRTYIVTGNPLYKQHFQEILAIRDGKIPRPVNYDSIYWDLVLSDDHRPNPAGEATSLLGRMRAAGFTKVEFDKLAEAKANSDTLTHTEFAAMALVESEPMSDQKRSQAILMVHDAAYHDAKAGIMRPISEFTTLVDQRTIKVIDDAEQKTVLMRSTFILLGVTLGWLIWSIQRNVRTILGGTVSEVHDHISRLGRGDFSTPITTKKGMSNSVIALLAETQSKLHYIDTQRQLAEQATKESEERFNLAITGANDGLWDRNLAQNTVYYSPRWKSMLGYEDHELANTYATWAGQVHPEDIDTILEKIDHCLTHKIDRFQHEYRIRQKNGQYIWVLDRGMIMRDENQTATRLVGIQTDISEQKYVERMKNEFISTVSHELRTPLTSIAASLGLLEAGVFGDLPAKALGLVAIANKNSKRLTVLVNDILDMEKLMSGKTVFRTDQIDMMEIVQQAIELNADYANSYSVQYKLCSPVGVYKVIGDRDRLMQVMANLMSNAAKFSPAGSVVEIRILAQKTMVRIEVEDHGPGIPDEFRHRIFSEFAQADSSDTRQQGGTGLGLNITQKLVARMDGEIGYETEVGKGSIFWFALPYAPDEG